VGVNKGEPDDPALNPGRGVIVGAAATSVILSMLSGTTFSLCGDGR
jgi:hypothetical protein